MILSTGGVERALGPHLQRIYSTEPTNTTARAARKDVVTISEMSSLVAYGRTCLSFVPDVRADKVMMAKETLETGQIPQSRELADAIVNSSIGKAGDEDGVA